MSILRLLPQDAESFAGGVYLPDAVECTVTETLEGGSELVMVYPRTGESASLLAYRKILCADASPARVGEPFRIYRMKRKLDGLLTVYARHISYDLNGAALTAALTEQTTPAAALAAIRTNCRDASRFTLTSEVAGTGSFLPSNIPVSARTLMVGGEESVQAVFGGEWLFSGMTCTLKTRRGVERARGIVYGDNLTSLRVDESAEECYSYVQGYWRRSGTVVLGSLVAVPGGSDLHSVLSLDLTNEFGYQPTTAQLDGAVATYITAQGSTLVTPSLDLDITYVPLEKTDDPYAGAEVPMEMGDTVPVYCTLLGVNVSARVNRTEYDPLLERYNELGLGVGNTGLSGTVASLTRQTTRISGEVSDTKGDKGDKGDTGAAGRGISSITKTSTSVLTDTYTITYTDGTSSTYQVVNGNGEPVSVSTEAAMDTVMVAANVGMAFLYTGATTSKYTQGDIYVVEVSS